MNRDNILRDIVSMPIKFYSIGSTESMYSLLRKSGYFSFHDTIHEEDIRKTLSEHPDYIDQWLILSQDKRTNAGWYFKEKKGGQYSVGYYSEKGISDEVIYFDKAKACSFFIKKEIENLRTTSV